MRARHEEAPEPVLPRGVLNGTVGANDINVPGVHRLEKGSLVMINPTQAKASDLL